MNAISIRVISKENILSIIPLLEKLNDKTPNKILIDRVLEMSSQNYECIGLYQSDMLIGICGLWYSTRHYIGKTAEVDHVIIESNSRNKGLGRLFFVWIYKYLKEKGCDATELNTFVDNKKSHRFYVNEGYDIYGFHMVKILRSDEEFY
jgi:GNAT superfamily N-acetyltransferase